MAFIGRLRLGALLIAPLVGMGDTQAVEGAGSADPAVHFDGSILQPYTNVWRYTVQLPDGSVHDQGLWTDQLVRTAKDGKPLLVRVQGTVLINGKTASVLNSFDPVSMAPVSDEQTVKGGGVQKRSFGADSVQSVRPSEQSAAQQVSTTTALPRPIYDYYGGMYALLLATAPLKLGYSGSFTSIDEFTDNPVAVEFRVTGQERVKAGALGEITAWKVESERAGQYKLVGWVTKTPPYVIRLNILTPDKKLYDWTML